jgi:hypothetical protein
MKFEVTSRDSMNELSRELSRAGIMNRKGELVRKDTSHYLVVKDKYRELLKKAGEIEPVEETLSELRELYEEIVSPMEIGEEKPAEEFLGEGEIERLILFTALKEAGAIKEESGIVKLLRKPKLEELQVELRFQIDDVEEYLDEIEERFAPRMVSEVSFTKVYYVEVLEVDRELIEAALEIAEDYCTEESYVDAMFTGIARSILAETVLELAERYRKKDELIDALLSREPLFVEGEDETVYVYFDEESIESFLKELQSLGYIKVKGNRIWV